jgi:hypothetical protein
MNCPKCLSTNNTTAGWITTKNKRLPVITYYDLYRGPHIHDLNNYTQLYKCENNHQFTHEFRVFCDCKTCPFLEFKKK